MLVFKVPENGGFTGARETYERRRPLMRPLPASERRRGLVILAAAKRPCGYYENGKESEDEPAPHGGSLFEPAKHWFFVFGRTCVLFYDPFVSAMMMFFVVFGGFLMLFAAEVWHRVLTGLVLLAVLWQFASILNEQSGIMRLIKGAGKENAP